MATPYPKRSARLRSHDATYAVLGKLLKLCAQPMAWSAKTLYDELENEFGKQGVTRAQIGNVTRGARRSGYIRKDFSATDKGQQKLLKLSFIQLAQKNTWDQKWRIVVFDIPEHKRGARDQIRLLLKQLGFEQLQLSVWVHPLPCLGEFKKIQDAYTIKDHITLIEATYTDQAPRLKKLFLNKYPDLF